jgi:hypothetical protein
VRNFETAAHTTIHCTWPVTWVGGCMTWLRDAETVMAPRTTARSTARTHQRPSVMRAASLRRSHGALGAFGTLIALQLCALELAVGAGVGAPRWAPPKGGPTGPNFIFLLADDVRHVCIICPLILTPCSQQPAILVCHLHHHAMMRLQSCMPLVRGHAHCTA